MGHDKIFTLHRRAIRKVTLVMAHNSAFEALWFVIFILLDLSIFIPCNFSLKFTDAKVNT